MKDDSGQDDLAEEDDSNELKIKSKHEKKKNLDNQLIEFSVDSDEYENFMKEDGRSSPASLKRNDFCFLIVIRIRLPRS